MTKRHLVLTKKDDSTSGGKDTTTNAEAQKTEMGIIQQNSIIPSSQHPKDNNEVIIAPEEAVRALGLHQSDSTRSNIKQNFHFVRIRDQLVSRLELEASRNVILSVGIMLLFSLPWIIASMLAQICNENLIVQAIGEEETTEPLVGQCSRYYWTTTYTRLILLIGHSLYQSVCYVTRSKDFSSALRQAHKRRCNGCYGARQTTNKVNRQPPQRLRRMRRH